MADNNPVKRTTSIADLDKESISQILSYIDDFQTATNLALSNRMFFNSANEAIAIAANNILLKSSRKIGSAKPSGIGREPSKNKAAINEGDPVLQLIKRYPKVFIQLCGNAEALKLISSVGDEKETFSTRMVNLFKFYLYFYTEENPFSPDLEGYFTRSNRAFLYLLSTLPYFPRIGTTGDPPTREEWEEATKKFDEKHYKITAQAAKSLLDD